MEMPWRASPGVYTFFTREDELVYIGRALTGTGLRTRIRDHFHPRRRGNPPWDLVMDDELAFVRLWSFDPQEACWAAALEVYLQERFPGARFNKRRS